MRRFRSIFLAALLAATLPATLAAAASRAGQSEALQRVIDEAFARYRQTTGYAARVQVKERIIVTKEQRLREIAREKHGVRRQIAAIRRALGNLEEAHGLALRDSKDVAALLGEERENLRAFLRRLHARDIADAQAGAPAGGLIVRELIVASLGERVEEDLQEEALRRARTDFLALLVDTQDLASALASLEGRHAALLAEEGTVRSERDQAIIAVHLTEAQLREIQRAVTEVHAQILRLQGELARIDARLKQRAERALVDLGLLPPQTGEHSTGEVASGELFSWPALGPISAGFLDASYHRHFGIPHHGMDIVVSQGTPVHAAADGVVFFVQRGGTAGYSYVLIGHRSGFATLYGHLSEINVAPGQEVRRGDRLGLSGGIPGTAGAGLMTTGAHLHFEVIRNGANIDPKAVLP